MQASAARPPSHGGAAFTMLLCALLWSSAGLVTRFLETLHGFSMVFWRSLFCALTLGLFLLLRFGWSWLVQEIRAGAGLFWASALCWATMFSAYMLAFSLTSVANVLVSLALEPFVSAVLSSIFLGARIPLRTWATIACAGAGMVWIFASAWDSGQWWGSVLALLVPLAAATNWVLLQKGAQKKREMLPALCLGAALSSIFGLLGVAWAGGGLAAVQATIHGPAHDVAWLAGLGVVQLALPCALAIWASKRLPAYELAMLASLEIVFGILLAWWGAGEQPSNATIQGGSVVILALLAHEYLASKEGRVNKSGLT